MDFDTLLHELSAQHGWNILYLKDEDAYRISQPTSEERFQDVYVNFRQDEDEIWYGTIWSVISDVEDFNWSDPKELMRFNWRNLYGSLAVYKDQVVLVQNQLVEEANWNEVGLAIRHIAKVADTIEEQIYGEDDKN